MGAIELGSTGVQGEIKAGVVLPWYRQEVAQGRGVPHCAAVDGARWPAGNQGELAKDSAGQEPGAFGRGRALRDF